jgi:hypothetical protein
MGGVSLLLPVNMKICRSPIECQQEMQVFGGVAGVPKEIEEAGLGWKGRTS